MRTLSRSWFCPRLSGLGNASLSIWKVSVNEKDEQQRDHVENTETGEYDEDARFPTPSRGTPTCTVARVCATKACHVENIGRGPEGSCLAAGDTKGIRVCDSTERNTNTNENNYRKPAKCHRYVEEPRSSPYVERGFCGRRLVGVHRFTGRTIKFSRFESGYNTDNLVLRGYSVKIFPAYSGFRFRDFFVSGCIR